MTTEYTIRSRTENATVDGELSNYADITVGGETTFDFYIQNRGAGYDLLKELQKYSQYVTITQTLGSVYYTVTSDQEDAGVDSPVVQIKPGPSISQAKGVWGVVTDVTDDTEIYGAIARVSVTVGVLARASEYDNHNSVINTFASDLGEDRSAEETTFQIAFGSAFVG
jgi:hypothetical protein